MCRVGARGQRFAYKGSEKKFNNSFSYIAEWRARANLFTGISTVGNIAVDSCH